MAIIINGITCQELVADFNENYDLLGGPSMRKGFLCPWANRFTVAQGLLGLNTSVKINGLITLMTPAQYPELATAYCKSINIIPVGPPTQGTVQCQWTNAIVYANYGCLPWSFGGLDGNFYEQQIDPATPLIYCEQTIQTSTQWKSLNGLGLKFSSGNVYKGFYALPVFQADISLTFMRVPYFPAQAIFTAGLAPLNSVTFLGQAQGFVLFNGASNHASRDTEGNMTQDLSLSFSYRSIRWDYDFDSQAGVFNQVQVGGVGIITTSDLNDLIPEGYLL